MPTYAPADVTFVRGAGTELWDAERQALPRLPVGPGRHRARPRQPGGRRRRRRAGPDPAARVEPVPHRARRGGGRHPRHPRRRRRAGRRQGVLRQLGRRGQRVRHQARPQVRRAGPARRRLRLRQLPRPDPRHPPRHRAAGQARAVPAPARGVPARRLRRRRRPRAGLDPSVGAVLLEPVQGEGGVNPAPAEYLRDVRAPLRRARDPPRCSTRCRPGLGRTGRWFGFQHAGVQPDVVTMAKALGNGVPIGACWARAEVAAAFEPGDHATTYGGQPLATAAARAVLAEMQRLDAPTLAAKAGERLVVGARSPCPASSTSGASACSSPPSWTRRSTPRPSPPPPSTPASSSTP